MSTEVDDETILDVLRSSGESRMTTTEVAEELPVTRGTTRSRLQQLADDGIVRREKSGNHVVWWLPEDDEESTAEGESVSESADDSTDGNRNDESNAKGKTEADPQEVEAQSDGTKESIVEDDSTDVPVEAVSPDGTVVEADDESEERRPTSDDPLVKQDDEEGLRAVAIVAVTLIVLLLLRRLLRDDGTT